MTLKELADKHPYKNMSDATVQIIYTIGICDMVAGCTSNLKVLVDDWYGACDLVPENADIVHTATLYTAFGAFPIEVDRGTTFEDLMRALEVGR